MSLKPSVRNSHDVGPSGCHDEDGPVGRQSSPSWGPDKRLLRQQLQFDKMKLERLVREILRDPLHPWQCENFHRSDDINPAIPPKKRNVP